MDEKWFEVPALGTLKDEQAELKINQQVEPVRGSDRWWWKQRAYMHTNHVAWFIEPDTKDEDGTLSIVPASTITPNPSLVKQPVTITLDKLHVAEYPGRSDHTILFDFYVQNHVEDQSEDVHFSQLFRGKNGQSVGVLGYPLFVGLNLDTNGLAFRGVSVNVKNSTDETVLATLESDGFKKGIELLSTIQPAVKIASEFALKLTTAVAKRHRNIVVQEFFIGLDAGGDSVTRPKLRQGTYIIMQCDSPPASNDYRFDPSKGIVSVSKEDAIPFPFNYMIISITPSQPPVIEE